MLFDSTRSCLNFPHVLHIMGICKPRPDVSYGFILAMYGILCAISALLYSIEHMHSDAGTAKSVQGLWMVAAPAALFIPAVAWLWWQNRQATRTPKRKAD